MDQRTKSQQARLRKFRVPVNGHAQDRELITVIATDITNAKRIAEAAYRTKHNLAPGAQVWVWAPTS